jgi:hypothetical protein
MNENVLGDVVDDAMRIRVVERTGVSVANRSTSSGQLFRRVEPLAQRLAFDERHDEIPGSRSPESNSGRMCGWLSRAAGKRSRG